MPIFLWKATKTHLNATFRLHLKISVRPVNFSQELTNNNTRQLLEQTIPTAREQVGAIKVKNFSRQKKSFGCMAGLCTYMYIYAMHAACSVLQCNRATFYVKCSYSQFKD